MKKFITPEIEILKLNFTDVIASSDNLGNIPTDPGEEQLPWA